MGGGGVNPNDRSVNNPWVRAGYYGADGQGAPANYVPTGYRPPPTGGTVINADLGKPIQRPIYPDRQEDAYAKSGQQPQPAFTGKPLQMGTTAQESKPTFSSVAGQTPATGAAPPPTQPTKPAAPAGSGFNMQQSGPAVQRKAQPSAAGNPFGSTTMSTTGQFGAPQPGGKLGGGIVNPYQQSARKGGGK